VPTYTVTDPSTGKQLKLTGDSPPTEAELTQIFASTGGSQSQPGVGEQLWNAFKETGPQNVYNRQNLPLIGAAIAGAATGGAGAIPVLAASGFGGAIGEGVRQATSGEEANPAQMGVEGLKQAAQVGLGEGAGKVLGAGVGLIRSAAAGAAEGGIGGAVARVVRNTIPVESGTMMIQALKPRNTQTGFPDALKVALPEIKAVEQQAGKPITTIEEFLDAAKAAKKQIWSQWEVAAGPKRAMGSVVNGDAIADGIVQSIPSRTLRQNPQAAAAIHQVADSYRGDLPLQDAEQLLKETNAELQAYYDKFPRARTQAETSNPEIAHLLAEAKGLRAGINKTIDAEGEGAAARELKRRYGALSAVEDAAQRRSMVAARQQPESLSEQIGKVRAAGEYAKGLLRLSHGDLMGAGNIAAARAGSAAATFLKEQQTTDALIRRAMAGNIGLPAPIPQIQQPVIRGLLPPGVTRLGPATVGGLDPSDVPGSTVRGQYGQP
jgi:hypothetical protein